MLWRKRHGPWAIKGKFLHLKPELLTIDHFPLPLASYLIWLSSLLNIAH
jgi:hypothetical protein